MERMTGLQFEALADLLRLRDGPSQKAAIGVLVHGQRPADAARACGLSPQAVSNVLTRCQRGIELARIVVGRPID